MVTNDIKKLIKKALIEDIGKGDITTNAIVPQEKLAFAKLIAKDYGILAGVEIAKYSFVLLDKRMTKGNTGSVKWTAKLSDGSTLVPGKIIAEIYGPAKSILTAERTALNFLQKLSGIATESSKFTKKIKPFKTKILDTRKTTPLLRTLEKYAVKVGGGFNHRFGLYDAILIKDNHIKIAGSVREAIRMVKNKYPNKKIEIEVQSFEQLKEALKFDLDRIMLDNMNISDIKKAVKLVRHKSKLEVSGGVHLKNVRNIAKTGVDYISIGCITHSPKSLDISLEFE
ncbi:MAG: carboxylating nicotinate-nucleotide diphosphorylase [Candidatus Firestonebacteria bacterium]